MHAASSILVTLDFAGLNAVLFFILFYFFQVVSFKSVQGVFRSGRLRRKTDSLRFQLRSGQAAFAASAVSMTWIARVAAVVVVRLIRVVSHSANPICRAVDALLS